MKNDVNVLEVTDLFGQAAGVVFTRDNTISCKFGGFSENRADRTEAVSGRPALVVS